MLTLNRTGPLKTGTTRVVAPASTVHFSPKTTSSFPNPIGDKPELKEPADKNASKIAPGTPYADLVNPETIVVLSQPEGQACAVVGGINGVRMEQLGAKGILVSGRVRDLDTLNGLKIPVWSKGTSSVGAGAQTKAYAVGYPVEIGEVTVVSVSPCILSAPPTTSTVGCPKYHSSAKRMIRPVAPNPSKQP